MEERRVAEYLVVAGLPPSPRPLADFSCDGATLKSTHSLPPITDLAIINRSLGEVTPDGYTCIELTPSGLVANVNHGALRAPEMFICYRRGRDKQPLVDVGVLYEGRERVMPDSQIVEFTHGGRSANINSSGQTTYMTYRRASDNAACNELVVSDICVIMTNRGDQAPHSYCTIDRNLNKNTMVGSDIYVCYKKSMNRTTSLPYMAGLLDRYPSFNRPGFPLPPDLALFCLPMGATLESWPAQSTKPNPVFSTFVLTVTAGEGVAETVDKAVEKVYGAAVTFYEKYPHDRLTPDQRLALKLDEHFGRHNLVHTNKCVCILSRWPFFDAFERFLKYLHHMANSGPYLVPIERYVHYFLEEVPFPSARRPRILLQLDATERISLAQPEDSPITLSGAKFYQLVMTLRPEGCLTVLLFTLTEQKILLHSLRPDVLTAVAEAMSMIIFPFHWQCPYVPLCPLGLSDILNAPIPFLLGLDSRFFDLYDPPSDVICVDLDTGAISVPEDKKYLISKLLPSRAARTLRSCLELMCEKIHRFEKTRQNYIRTRKTEPDAGIDSEFSIKRKEQELDVEIQESFLRFTASVLQGYSDFLLPIVSANTSNLCDTASLFDLQAFVKSRDRKYHKFYNLLVNTQMFSKFIEERSFVSDKDASLAFFDVCAEKVEDDDPTIKLLEVEATQSEHTLFLPPPDASHLPEGIMYSYNAFPKLRSDLFPPQEVLPALPPQVRAPQVTPASPLARRTKQEVKTDQRLASRYSQTPILWAKCLLSTCYSLWFTQLPAFASTQQHKSRSLQLAFKILTNMQKLHLNQADEVSYRVMMQLCGLYSQPILAVKVLCEMRQHGITPNAITYGYYNTAVMENKWTHSNLFWNKLRNVVLGVSAFRQCGRERALRLSSSLSLDVVDKCLTDADSSSRVSLESGTSLDSHPPVPHTKTDTLSSDPGYCSVSETSESVSPPGTVPPLSTTTDSLPTTTSTPPPPLPCSPLHRNNTTTTTTSTATNNSSSSSSSSSSLSSTSTLKPSSPPPLSSSPSVTTTVPSSQPQLSSSSSSTTTTTTTTSNGLVFSPSSSEPESPTVPPSTSQLPPTSRPSVISSSDPPLHPLSLPGHTVNTTTFSPARSLNSHTSSQNSSPAHNSYSSPSHNSLPRASPSHTISRTSSPSHTLSRTSHTSSPSRTASPYNRSALGFSGSDRLRARLGSIVRSTPAGLASGANLALLQCYPAFSSSAGVLMSSVVDSSVLHADTRVRHHPPSDLAHALSPTLHQYDKIEATANAGPSPPSPPGPATPQDRTVPEYLRSDSYGSDAKIITNLLRLTRVDIEPIAQVGPLRGTPTREPSDTRDDPWDSKGGAQDTNTNPEDGRDLMTRSSDSLSDISEEGTPRSGRVQGFFSRNAPERLSSLFRRSVDSADGRLRGLWRRGASLGSSGSPSGSGSRGESISRSSSKDSVNLEAGVAEYLEGPTATTTTTSASLPTTPPTSLPNTPSTYSSSDKTPEPPGTPLMLLGECHGEWESERKGHTETKREGGSRREDELERRDLAAQTLLPPPRSPNINIRQDPSYSPVPSSPRRTPVTENDPLGAFNPLGSARLTPRGTIQPSTDPNDPNVDPLAKLLPDPFGIPLDGRQGSDHGASRDSQEREGDEELEICEGREAQRANRRVARSATFTGHSDQDSPRHLPVQRSANSLWTLIPPTTTTNTRPQDTSTGTFHHHQDSSTGTFHHYQDPSLQDPNSSILATTAPASTWLSFSNSSSGGRLGGVASNMATVGLREAGRQIEHLRAQFIHPALQEMGTYSPGNFNYRKSELLSGGLSSVKSAMTSFSKKYNEFREAITATPVKGAHSMRLGDGDGDEDSLDGLFWSRRESADTVSGVAPLDDPHQGFHPTLPGLSWGGLDGDTMGPLPQAPHQDLFPPLGWDAGGPFCLGLWVTSCTRCHNCSALLYDEEIMAGWRPDDSNLNTKCTFCEKVTVPVLTITMYDARHLPKPEHHPKTAHDHTNTPEKTERSLDEGSSSSSSEGRTQAGLKDNIGTQLQKKGVRLEGVTVPYLSPLVLRKEFETVLSHEGDTCLTHSTFTDHHPILYWNLLWYFARLRVPSHLPGLCLGAACVTRDRTAHPSWANADWQNVYVSCLWDNTKYHEELGVPMYVQWQQLDPPPSPLVSALVRERSKVPRDVMQSVVTAVHVDDLSTALRLLLQELRKRPATLRRSHFPLYRDLLFLAAHCIPPPHLNLTAFDREYRRAYERCEGAQSKLLATWDKPPPIAAVFCRRYFSPLAL